MNKTLALAALAGVAALAACSVSTPDPVFANSGTCTAEGITLRL